MTEQNEQKKQITAKDVADFFLAKANSVGDQITNLKLQKLVYYAQAWHLANFNKPLFDEDFEAWVHGPVLPDLYHTYKERGSAPILTDLDIKVVAKRFDSDTINYLNEVASIYMPHGAYELELMTHKEEPWIDTRGECEPDEKCDNIISKESMKTFYESQIKD
ncbi:SocA family protein [Candidatus Parcubacteria bacterium]|nr:SocA family protein [Candidatus Parcubacteria bacterium]